jgi:hypothetical protein
MRRCPSARLLVLDSSDLVLLFRFVHTRGVLANVAARDAIVARAALTAAGRLGGRERAQMADKPSPAG